MTKDKKVVDVDAGVGVIETKMEQLTVKQAMVKALVITGRANNEDAALELMNDHGDALNEVNAVDPLLDMEALMSLYEISDSLRQNIDAYVTNIEANGHVLEPKIDLETDESSDQVKTAMDAANWADAVTEALSDLKKTAEESGDDITPKMRRDAIENIKVTEPTDAEVRERKEELSVQIQREMHMATAWFRNVHPELSFLDLRERKRVDEESIGHAAWEVMRDDNGLFRRLEPMPGYTVLPVKSSINIYEVPRQEWVSELETRTVLEKVRFRLYVQKVGSKTVFYKDLDDPRLVSDKTGKIYMKVENVDGKRVLKQDPERMKESESDAMPANELIYFAIYHPKTTAGMVRWAAMSTAMIGSRAAALANLAYFENHAIPDAVLMISGGQLNNESVERIQEMIRSKAKGPGNHHRTLVVQATGGTKTGGRPNEVVNNPTMEWVNLSDFQNGDALFANYTKDNKEAVSSSFRQALLLIGYIPSDLNRATALAILSLAEKQVYGPLRNKFDWWVNNTLLPSIGIKLITFTSLSPEATNIEEMAKAIEPGIKGGAFTPNDLRALYSQWLNQEFKKFPGEWADEPWGASTAQLDLDTAPPDDENKNDNNENEPQVKGEKDSNNRLTELESQFSKLLNRLEKDAENAKIFGN